MFSFDEIKNADIEIAEAMQDEMDRQQSHLELIASGSYGKSFNK